jgi:phosphate starvation-inducible PhoH-like protein
MFLTRMGVCSKFIMTGDTTQIDLPRKSESGLLQAMRILSNIENISIIKFDERDIVRHKLVKKIVRAYEQDENDPPTPPPDASLRWAGEGKDRGNIL